MRTLLMAGLAAVLVAACGGTAGAGAGTGGTPVPKTVDALTAAQVVTVAQQAFPLVKEYGYYGVCGLNGDTSACPYSDRLKSRLAELRDTLLRAQNPSQTLEVTAELTGPSTGVAHVTLFGGRQKLDLAVVSAGGRVLVDDEICAGRPGTSIYEPFTVC